MSIQPQQGAVQVPAALAFLAAGSAQNQIRPLICSVSEHGLWSAGPIWSLGSSAAAGPCRQSCLPDQQLLAKSQQDVRDRAAAVSRDDTEHLLLPSPMALGNTGSVWHLPASLRLCPVSVIPSLEISQSNESGEWPAVVCSEPSPG